MLGVATRDSPSQTLLPMHMLHGPVIPEETSSRFVRVPGARWTVRDFGDPNIKNYMEVGLAWEASG